MGLAEVEKSCCGCSLETGTIIIGSMNAIGSFFMIIGYLHQLTQPIYSIDDFQTREYYAIYETISLVLLLFAIFGFVIAIMLIVAVKKRIEAFFNIWLFFSSYNMVSSVVPMLTFTIFCFYLSVPEFAVIFFIVYVLSIALGIYLLIVVNSCKLLVINKEMSSQEF